MKPNISAIILWAAITLAVLSIFTGCGPIFDHGWEIIGASVPEIYSQEIQIAAEVIRVQEGVLHREWGGTVEVLSEPFPCPDGAGLCKGWSGDPHAIHVTWDPAIGLGPVVGSTAIEWELCQAARMLRTCSGASPFNPSTCGGGDYDPEVHRCTDQATAGVIRRMQP